VTKHSRGRESWDLVLTPARGWFDLDIVGVWRYRDLVTMLVRRDFVALYKQTILGPLWYLIQPALTTVVFTLIFNRIAKIPTEGVPPFLFYMSGIVLWSYFANCLTKTSDTFTANAAIFGKVYFPRLVVPVSVVISNLLTYAIQFGLLLFVICVYWAQGLSTSFGLRTFLAAPLVAYVALLGLSVGVAVSSLTTRYRDLTFLVAFATQLWMYATPIVYPLSQIPEKWRWVFSLNPMSAPAETFRWIMFGSSSVSWSLWLGNIAISAALAVAGFVLFARVERLSMDTV
jgi:homopolymeric O-antigen transport system permease protein